MYLFRQLVLIKFKVAFLNVIFIVCGNDKDNYNSANSVNEIIPNFCTKTP